MNNIANYLSKLVRAQLYEEEIPLLPEDISVEEVIRISRTNHMDYLLLGAMLKGKIDEKYVPVLRQYVLSSTLLTLTQVNELKKLLAEFEEKGIVNQPMKGSVMKFMYPTPEMREMSDIDILIREEDMEKAAQVLRENGYELEQAIKHHDIYRKKPFMVIEAHRALYDKTVDKAQYEYFKDISKRELREGCKYTYDFSKEEFYVYMMAHMAKHFYKMGCGIRNIVDVYIYNERFGQMLNRQYVEQELEKCGILTFTRHMEKLAQIWLGEEESTEFYDHVFDYMLNSGIYGKDENGIWNKFAEENQKEGKVSRLRLKFWYFFPPLAYMEEYYPWLEEKPYLLPWAWCVRAYGGIFKKKGVHKREMMNDISDEQVNVYRTIYQNMGLHFR